MRRDAQLLLSVPTHPEVSGQERFRAIAGLHEQHAHQLDQIFESTDSLPEELSEYRNALADLVGGASKYERAREYLTKERRKLFEPEREYPNTNARIEDQSSRFEHLARHLASLSVSREDLPKRMEYPPKHYLREDPLPHLAKGTDQQLYISGHAPTEPEWALISPPYGGWRYSYSWETINTFNPTHYQHLNPSSGRIVNQVVLENSDSNPTDSDYGTITQQASLGFWFRATTGGKLEAWVEIGAPLSLSGLTHHVSLEDRSGWSRGDVYQQGSLFMSVNGFQTTLALTSMNIVDKTDGSWSEFYYNGWEGPFWYHFLSSLNSPEDTWLWVEVGSRNYGNALMNDVNCCSQLFSYWDLLSVHIRMV